MKKIISLKNLSFLLAVLFVFSLCSCSKENPSIDLSNKLQKTIRYDYASFRTELGIETSPKDVTLKKYFGTYGDAIALMMDSEKEVYAKEDVKLVLAGRMFEFEDRTPIYIYSDYKFTELKEAYENGIISDSDVVGIYESFCKEYNIKIRGNIEPLDDRVEEIIKENYVKLYAENGLDISVENVQIREYFGLYSGAYAMFIKSEFDSYPQTPVSEMIYGVQFNYTDSEKISIYKDGKFYSVKEAYKTEQILTLDDVKDICYYLNFSNYGK